MNKPNNLFLVGPMGAGKSTIGRQLARDLKLDFYDADIEIEQRTGADLAWIFDVEGEEGFRIREENIIDELSRLQGILLATGGGVIASAENRKNLAARGTVVYLYATVSQQVKRTAREDRRRPLLRGVEPQEVLNKLMDERDHLYREIADIVVTTDGKSVRAVSQEVIELLNPQNAD
jgi:shikimate kinase